MIGDLLLTRFAQVTEFRYLWRRFPFGSVDTRVRYGIWSRPHYAYGVYAAADLAKQLNLAGISVIEFGVAGGRGLLALESIAGQVARRFGITIAVFGFDSGKGMPEPTDYRDLPHVWDKGFYEMDREKLQAKLSSAELILGDVGQSVNSFLQRPSILPIGFVAFDLDYYRSTKNALQVFDSSHHLPRVYCYFDDINLRRWRATMSTRVSFAQFGSSTWNIPTKKSANCTFCATCVGIRRPGTIKSTSCTISAIPSIV